MAELTHSEMEKTLIEIFSQRAKLGETPKNDSELLQPTFLQLTQDGLLVLKFPVYEWQCNGLGNLQGGMMSAMLDLAFGAFSYVLAGCIPMATIDMTSNYIRSVTPADEFVLIETVFPNRARRILHGESKAYKQEGKLVATASTNIIKL